MENIVLTEAYYYILLSLYKPLHGYGIMQKVEELSHTRLRLAAGTLYGALNSLLDKAWIDALPIEEGSRKKEYQITSLGQTVVLAELERLEELYENGKTITGGKTK